MAATSQAQVAFLRDLGHEGPIPDSSHESGLLIEQLKADRDRGRHLRVVGGSARRRPADDPSIVTNTPSRIERERAALLERYTLSHGPDRARQLVDAFAWGGTPKAPLPDHVDPMDLLFPDRGRSG
jgi:hypothetical protein